ASYIDTNLSGAFVPQRMVRHGDMIVLAGLCYDGPSLGRAVVFTAPISDPGNFTYRPHEFENPSTFPQGYKNAVGLVSDNGYALMLTSAGELIYSDDGADWDGGSVGLTNVSALAASGGIILAGGFQGNAR